jgi:hypothetical protein
VSIEILAALVSFAILIVTWALIPTHPESESKAVRMEPTAG